MQNFHTSPALIGENHIELTGEEYHHATRSCRVRIGEEIGVTDGYGRRVIARIDNIDHERLIAAILRDVSGQGEPTVALTIALAVIKAARFEAAVEKCTEIGARRIVPMITERMEPHADHRLIRGRLNRIAQSAAKQAARSWIPEVATPIGLDRILEDESGPILVAAQHADRTVVDICATGHDAATVTCLIGPEGDFTDAEYARMDEAGAIPIKLGGLTLRAETAAMAAALLIVQTFMGQMG